MYRIIPSIHKDYDSYVEKLKKIDSEYLEEKADLYVLEKEDGIEGYALLREEGKRIKLLRIFVVEGKRYCSIGTKLLNHIKGIALRKNIDEVFIAYSKADTVHFFEKNTFIKLEGGYSFKGIKKIKARTTEGLKGTWVSIIINIILSVLKIVVGYIGRSRALVADGFHSVSDVVGSFVILFSVHYGSVPEDEEHPYGHEKIESIAGIVVGVILILTAFELTRDSIISLIEGETKSIPSNITMVAAGISILVKYWMYIYKSKIAKNTKNDAVMADAREHKSDAISSIGVLLGILLSIYVNPIFDTVLSLLVSFIIGKEGFSILVETSDSILDKQDKKYLDEIEEYIKDEYDLSSVHDMLMRVSGNKVFLSFHIRLPKDMSVYDAHQVADEIHYGLLDKYKELRDVTIHIDYIID